MNVCVLHVWCMPWYTHDILPVCIKYIHVVTFECFIFTLNISNCYCTADYSFVGDKWMNALVFAKPLSALTLCCWALDEYFAINALTKEHWVSVLTSSRNDEPRNIRLGGNSEVNVGVDPKDVEGVAVVVVEAPLLNVPNWPNNSVTLSVPSLIRTHFWRRSWAIFSDTTESNL